MIQNSNGKSRHILVCPEQLLLFAMLFYAGLAFVFGIRSELHCECNRNLRIRDVPVLQIQIRVRAFRSQLEWRMNMMFLDLIFDYNFDQETCGSDVISIKRWHI